MESPRGGDLGKGGSMRLWTQRRLENLFQKYRNLYFDGHLKDWGAAVGGLGTESLLGRCDFEHKQLIVDTDRQPNAEVHATLLHEMAHAASGRPEHGYRFWEQVELLLKKKAPVTLGRPESPNNRTFQGIIPKRLRLCSEAMKALESRRVKRLEKHIKMKGISTHQIADEEIKMRFRDVFYESFFDMSDAQIVTAVAREYDLLDVEGKPKTVWAANLIAEGKKICRDLRRQEKIDLAREVEISLRRDFPSDAFGHRKRSKVSDSR
jgi:hypothetical protein